MSYMGYKDTKETMVCPYNSFKECCYDACPFFHAEWFKSGTLYGMECKKAIADIEMSKQTINNNINVAATSRSSMF